MEQQYPGSHYQPLFDLMMNEHNLTLLDTDMADIIDVVRKMEQPVEQKLVAMKEQDGRWWRVEVHHEAGVPESGCSGDVNVTITDGKVTLYFDGGIDDEDEQRLCNMLNELKIKLDYDHSAEFVASEYERMNKESCDEIRRLKEQAGMRWVKITTEDSLPPEDNSTEPKKYFIRCQESDENRENPYMRCDYLSRVEIEDDCQGTNWYEWLDESISTDGFWEAAYHQLFALYQPLRERSDTPASTKVAEINDAMIDAVYEGAELWRQEYDDCRRILQELVTLKMVKDTEGKTPEYQERQPLAWKAAIEFLNVYQHLGE